MAGTSSEGSTSSRTKTPSRGKTAGSTGGKSAGKPSKPKSSASPARGDAAPIPPVGTLTFTIERLPRTERARKTLVRLMRMNPSTQRALSRLSRNRVNNLNERRPRAGRIWLTRVRATRVVDLAVGERFTLTMTPQIVKDVQSVEAYLARA